MQKDNLISIFFFGNYINGNYFNLLYFKLRIKFKKWLNWQKSLWSNWRLEKRKRNNKYEIVPTLGKCFYRELKYVWIKKINKNILKLDNKIDHKIFCKKRKRNDFEDV